MGGEVFRTGQARCGVTADQTDQPNDPPNPSMKEPVGVDSEQEEEEEDDDLQLARTHSHVPTPEQQESNHVRHHHADAGTVIPIPPQPGPAVQETSFAPDVSSEPRLAVLEHEPISDDPNTGPESGSHRVAAATASNYGTTNSTVNNNNGMMSTHHQENGRNQTASNKPSPARSIPPDLLRGLLMILMALDHNVMTLRSWPHATAIDGETDDGHPVEKWNSGLAYVIRTLTHLCAPGFMFLLGMGVVYFGRSRTQLGWSAGRMIWHFGIRGVILTLLSVLLGLGLSRGRVWFLNIVLVALGVDYFLVGVGWVVLRWTEALVARMVLGVLKLWGGAEKKIDEEEQPLLLPPSTTGDDSRVVHEDEGLIESIAPDRSIIRASDISWHLHNVVLLGLAVLTIWWNIWLSPTGGGCFEQQQQHSGAELDIATTSVSYSLGSRDGLGEGGWTPPESILWFRFWFYPVQTSRVMSGFPPLAWISFAILGLLYGRIILARSWSATAITAGNLVASMVFLSVFVATRLLHVGNLSEGCLHMPEHHTSSPAVGPDRHNQYLASPASFFYLIKYPPDVAFWSFAMGINLLLLALFSIIPPGIATRGPGRVLLVYGTSALFFYVIHIPLLGLIAETVFIPWLGHEMDFDDVMSGGGKKAVGVDNLWAFWGNWVIVLALLYPACRWYGLFKKRRGVDSIWRFF